MNFQTALDVQSAGGHHWQATVPTGIGDTGKALDGHTAFENRKILNRRNAASIKVSRKGTQDEADSVIIIINAFCSAVNRVLFERVSALFPHAVYTEHYGRLA